VNGESNAIEVTIENKSGKNATLLSIAGGFYNPGSESLIKSVRSLSNSSEFNVHGRAD
jgi:hypothetical protein